ncbi:MAG: glycosyltransferase family 9 protein [Pseudomonadota bacterium]
MTAPESRILVIQLARFGDFLQTTPLLTALKARRPGARLFLLVNSPQAALARANPDVDEVLVADLGVWNHIARNGGPYPEKIAALGRLARDLQPRDFDLVVNLNTSRLAALLAGLFRADRRAGPALGPDRAGLVPAPWADLIMNLMTRRRLIRFNLVDLLASYAEGGERTAAGLTYPVSAQARAQARAILPLPGPGPLVGFQLGSRHVSRQWPPDYFARLVLDLMEQYQAQPVFLGLESERPLGAEVKARLRDLRADAPDRVTDLMGRTSLETLGGVAAGLDLLVAGDTGTMHLAAAVKTKILALFIGPAWCHETGPYGEGQVVLQTNMGCSPCTEGQANCGDHPCRKLIGPDAVLEAAAGLLNNRPPRLGPWRRPELRFFLSRLDRFGVVFRPLLPEPLEREEVLALALREAGRGYIRPDYEFRPDLFRRELLACYLPGPSAGREAPVDLETAPLPRILAGLARRGEQDQARRFVRTLDQAAALAPPA